jgi:hypothetical protein
VRIAIDWDGTLVENVWPAMGDWLPGAVAALHQLVNDGHKIKIHTCRIGPFDVDEITLLPKPRQQKEINDIKAMLRKEGLHHKVKVWVKRGKPGADVYIDDRGLRFEGNWTTTLAQVNNIQRKS